MTIYSFMSCGLLFSFFSLFSFSLNFFSSGLIHIWILKFSKSSKDIFVIKFNLDTLYDPHSLYHTPVNQVANGVISTCNFSTSSEKEEDLKAAKLLSLNEM